MHRELLNDSECHDFPKKSGYLAGVHVRTSKRPFFANNICPVKMIFVFTIAVLCTVSGFSQASEVTVSGRVVSEADGAPLPGVNILQKDTQNGTVTDSEGKYSLRVSSNAILVFSFIGFQSKEISVNNRSVVDVTLAQDMTQLDEVVVIGYGTQKKSDLTGSVSSVNAEAFEGRNITSFEQGLQGQAPGVHVNQATGQPGGRTIVRIRGQNSILGSSDPLYVLDGVPIQSGTDGNTSLLANISPNDIATIDILKDASATAIYGARGSNGVILITTKRGRAGQRMITLESSTRFSTVAKELDFLNAREFVELANERAINDNQALPFPDVDAAIEADTDWQDEIFQTALTQNYTLNFSGGDEDTQYFVSGSYMDQEGVIIGSGFSRGSFRVNLNQQASKRLRFASQLTVSRSVADRSPTDGTNGGILRDALGSPPFLPARDANGQFTPGEELYRFSFSESGGDNPLITAHERMNKLSTNRFVGNIRTQYDFLDNFSAELMLGADYSARTLDSYTSRLKRGVPDGEGSERRTDDTYFIVENLYKYKKVFGGDSHQIDAVAGFTWESLISKFLSASAEGFITDDFLNQNLGAGERFSSPSNGVTEWDIVSFLGRINYSFKDRYLITVSGRRDGSSRFGEGNKWAFFPSFALAWRIADENFMKDVDKISNMKLRFSWGKSGNQAVSPYQSIQRFTPQPLVIGESREVGFAPANLGNPNLRWETTKQIDVGLDFGIWDERFRVSLDLYKKTTSDLLALVVLPPTSGFSSVVQNTGVIENKGIELNMGFDILDKQNTSWNINFNIASNRNRVVKLDKGSDIVTIGGYTGESILREGEPVSSFYGIQEDGLTDNGLINYVDQDGDATITNNDRVIIGNPHPDFVFGLTSQFDYKNFFLSVFLQGEYGKDILNDNLYWHGLPFFRGNNVTSAVADRWTPENPNTDAAWPKATMSINFFKSDRYIEDGSYLRLKNVRLGYNIPVEKSPFKSASVFLNVENLLTFTNYSWYDPDINTFQSEDIRIGWDLNTYPLARTLTIGVNLGF